MRMGGFSSVIRRPAAAGDPTHALFADQSHSIPDNLVALLGAIRAWHCSPKPRLVLGRMQDQQLRFQVTDARTSAILTTPDRAQAVRGVCLTQNRQSARILWNDCYRYGLPTFADPVVKG